MTRARHYLVTAHLVVAVVALLASLGLAIRAADVILSPGVEALGGAALCCRLAAIAYLLAAATTEVDLARRLRRGTVFAPGAIFYVACQALLLAVVASILVRGPAARLYLVGLDHLLAAVLTVTCLSLGLAGLDRWLARREGADTLPVDAILRTAAARAIGWVFLAAGLALVSSLGYLESRPLPGTESPAPTTAMTAGREAVTAR